VINWGESTFYQGINSIQNRADARAANTPGVEVKEILLPTGAIYGQVDLLPNLTVEAYYQYEWLENELNGVGSYFSTTDQIGPGSNAFIIPTPGSPLVPEEIRGNEFNLRGVPKSPDQEASDSGQWGAAFHYITENSTDIGFYHVVGHDKKPSFVLSYEEIFGNRVPVSYLQRYYEDIRGTAISFTTILGETNVQGELSWLDGTPMVDAAGDPQRENLAKLQLGGSHVFLRPFMPTSIAQQSAISTRMTVPWVILSWPRWIIKIFMPVGTYQCRSISNMMLRALFRNCRYSPAPRCCLSGLRELTSIT
jgi:hypothetical protein